MSALAAALLALALVPLAAPPASAAPTIVGVALDAQGRPLQNVNWNVYEQVGGQWQGLQMGPLLTDANGRFTWNNAVAGKGYRICFSDTYYDQVGSGEYWLADVRHRDTCWHPTADATSVGSAQTWTASGTGATFTVKMPGAGLGQAPVAPFMTGSFEVGKPLTVVGAEGWRPTTAALTYQWFRDGVAIPGATAATYTPVAADDGKWIMAGLTGSRSGYKTARLVSQVTKVGGTHATLSSALKLTGTAAPGKVLTASFGKPTMANHTMLDWYVDGVPQPRASTQGQASASFAVTPAMAGARIEARLKVYLTDTIGNYKDGSDSFHRAVVTVAGTRPPQPRPVSAAPAVASTPVAGATAVGATLSAPGGLTADPAATTTYQWLRGGVPIAGATAATYRLQPADIGYQIAVAATVARPGWWSGFLRTSTTSGVVQGVLPAATAKLKGTPRVGGKLKAKVAVWKGVPLTYRWLRNGKPIKPAKRATKASYTPTAKDRGKKITVVVTTAKPSYVTVTATAKAKRIKR